MEKKKITVNDTKLIEQFSGFVKHILSWQVIFFILYFLMEQLKASEKMYENLDNKTLNSAAPYRLHIIHFINKFFFFFWKYSYSASSFLVQQVKGQPCRMEPFHGSYLISSSSQLSFSIILITKLYCSNYTNFIITKPAFHFSLRKREMNISMPLCMFCTGVCTSLMTGNEETFPRTCIKVKLRHHLLDQGGFLIYRSISLWSNHLQSITAPLWPLM